MSVSFTRQHRATYFSKGQNAKRGGEVRGHTHVFHLGDEIDFISKLNQKSQMSCVQSFANQLAMLKGRLSVSAITPKGPLDVRMRHEGRMKKILVYDKLGWECISDGDSPNERLSEATRSAVESADITSVSVFPCCSKDGKCCITCDEDVDKSFILCRATATGSEASEQQRYNTDTSFPSFTLALCFCLFLYLFLCPSIPMICLSALPMTLFVEQVVLLR